ncbi:Protease 4 [Planctomycetes bacterium Pan216]|uniref:Protease 4 n=1 Tax=Kolteria novifilia TaxID=2527975 RepID=A0A518B970_9BACT|nr:Protease 4 [Planctomycetes bacterium Pan216]
MQRFRWFLVLVSAAVIPVAGARGAEADNAMGTIHVAHINLTKAIPETPQPTGFFGEQDDNLRAVAERIAKAAKDDQVKALYLKVGGMGVGFGQIYEFRESIANFKKSGKKVYADLGDGLSGAYLLACSADEIIVPPAGAVLLTGIRMQVLFLKDLLGKIGVEADFVQVGDYKGAAEPLTRSSMSKAFRKQLTSVLDDYFEQMVGLIAESRGLEVEKVRKLIDEGPFSPEDAKKAGLIDRVTYMSDLRSDLAKEFNAKKVVFKMNYGRRNIEKEFEGIAGLMKLLSSMSGQNKKPEGFSLKPRIALIYATGPIMTGASDQGFGDGTTGSSTLIKAIRAARDDGKVSAIVLRIDSPGGSALASDLIWHELKKSGKPVVASMGNTAASGGYYIALGAEKIYAEPGTLTGSIGVVGGKFALKGLMDKVGLNAEVISRGKNANLFSLETKFSASERTAITGLMESIYERFTSITSESRDIPSKELTEYAEGRVWTGRQAKKIGLVDELGTLNDAIDAAKELAKLSKETKVDVKVFPKPPTALEAILGPIDEGLPRDARIWHGLLAELGIPIDTIDWLRPMVKERILLLPPAILRVW